MTHRRGPAAAHPAHPAHPAHLAPAPGGVLRFSSAHLLVALVWHWLQKPRSTGVHTGRMHDSASAGGLEDLQKT